MQLCYFRKNFFFFFLKFSRLQSWSHSPQIGNRAGVKFCLAPQLHEEAKGALLRRKLGNLVWKGDLFDCCHLHEEAMVRTLVSMQLKREHKVHDKFKSDVCFKYFQPGFTINFLKKNYDDCFFLRQQSKRSHFQTKFSSFPHGSASFASSCK